MTPARRRTRSRCGCEASGSARCPRITSRGQRRPHGRGRAHDRRRQACRRVGPAQAHSLCQPRRSRHDGERDHGRRRHLQLEPFRCCRGAVDPDEARGRWSHVVVTPGMVEMGDIQFDANKQLAQQVAANGSTSSWSGGPTAPRSCLAIPEALPYRGSRGSSELGASQPSNHATACSGRTTSPTTTRRTPRSLSPGGGRSPRPRCPRTSSRRATVGWRTARLGLPGGRPGWCRRSVTRWSWPPPPCRHAIGDASASLFGGELARPGEPAATHICDTTGRDQAWVGARWYVASIGLRTPMTSAPSAARRSSTPSRGQVAEVDDQVASPQRLGRRLWQVGAVGLLAVGVGDEADGDGRWSFRLFRSRWSSVALR